MTPWIVFNVFVLAMLALDLGVFHRKAHAVSLKEAGTWSVVWVTLAMLFNLGVWKVLGPQRGMEFLTGYLIEKALSVDNIFVFVLVFSYFRVPAAHQHRILFWGIIGALLMRGAMIGTGVWLLERFSWIVYVFGGFLVLTGIRMAFHDETDIEPEANPVIRLLRRVIPIVSGEYGQKFFVRTDSDQPGHRPWLPWAATPLFVVLVVIETTDLVFALDSIPAIFAITRDPFLVYTSNERFHFLKLGLSIVLVFVGVKMLVAGIYHLPIGLSLAFIALVLATSVIASLLFPRTTAAHSPVTHSATPEDTAGSRLETGDSTQPPHMGYR
ncbi:MAG TPA: TerC family protein [Thermoanaerobaculia bacterium]